MQQLGRHCRHFGYWNLTRRNGPPLVWDHFDHGCCWVMYSHTGRAFQCISNSRGAIPLDLHSEPCEMQSSLGKIPQSPSAPLADLNLQSYCCGAVNIFSWIAISAGVAILPAQFIISMVIYNDPTYESRTWHSFLIYQTANIVVLLYNIFAMKRTSWIHDVGCTYQLWGPSSQLQPYFNLKTSCCVLDFILGDPYHMFGTGSTNANISVCVDYIYQPVRMELQRGGVSNWLNQPKLYLRRD